MNISVHSVKETDETGNKWSITQASILHKVIIICKNQG